MTRYFLILLSLLSMTGHSLEKKEAIHIQATDTQAEKREREKNILIELAKKKAIENGISPALLCAIIETESGWLPNNLRFEPHTYHHIVLLLEAKKLSHDEIYLRATSFGLMQLMGESARELHFKGASLMELCDPTTNLEWGCKLLNRKMKATSGDIEKTLLSWNGGSNPRYPGLVMSKIKRYENQITD